MAGVPDVDEVRPRRCPCCGSAARPIGRALVLVGHGLRERQQWGPLEVGSLPTVVRLLCRRYRCRRCAAVVVVVPRGVVRHRRYSGPAIGYGLAMWASGRSAASVRARVSPFGQQGFGAPGWDALADFATAAAAGRLFRAVPRSPESDRPRRAAERAAQTLAALAPSQKAGSVAVRAFFGAAHAA